MKKAVSCGIFLVLLLTGYVWSHDIKSAKVEVLTKTTSSWDGTALPNYARGKPEITILKITVAPKTTLPFHKHPVINAGVLLKGKLTVVTERKKTLHLKAGNAIVEVVDKWHYGKNESNEPAVIIVFYAGVQGEPVTIEKKVQGGAAHVDGGAQVAPVVGILGAMPLEVAALEQELTDKKVRIVQRVRFITGRLKGRMVVVAYSGEGEVNAAMATALLLQQFRPKHVIFTGIAGGVNPELGPGDIVIGSKTTYYDYGELTPKGFLHSPTIDPFTQKPNPLFYPADAGLLAKAKKAAASLKLSRIKTSKGDRTPRVVTGVIVTGNTFVASPARSKELRHRFKADATEMEGAAVAQICWQQHVPCLVIRSLSDDAGGQAKENVHHFEKTAARNSSQLVTSIVAQFESK